MRVRRWPKNAEHHRRAAFDAAADARELLEQARDEIQRNPRLAREKVTDAMLLTADIMRWLVEARIGVNGDEGSE